MFFRKLKPYPKVFLFPKSLRHPELVEGSAFKGGNAVEAALSLAQAPRLFAEFKGS